MNQLKVSGKQSFMGNSIPVVSGGFGQGKKCMCDNTVAELAVDVDNINADVTNLKHINSYQWRAIKRLRKQNYDLQKWLEGYIKLLFAIVVCFIIAVCVL